MKPTKRIYDRKGIVSCVIDKTFRTEWLLPYGIIGREYALYRIDVRNVSELTKAGMSDSWIMRNIGMDKDELYGFNKLSGLAELFADKEFSLRKRFKIIIYCCYTWIFGSLMHL